MERRSFRGLRTPHAAILVVNRAGPLRGHRPGAEQHLGRACVCVPTRKTLAVPGLMAPLSTSPHWQDLGSAMRTLGMANFRSASKREYSSRSLTARRSDRSIQGFATRKIRAIRQRAPPRAAQAHFHLFGNHAGVLIFDFDATLSFDLPQDHPDRLQDIERLEAGDHHRLAIKSGDELPFKERSRSPSRRGPARENRPT